MTKVQLPDKFECLFEPSRYKAFYGGRGSAKCLARGTEVIMFDGTIKKIEDVKVGDLLMGPDSSSRTVLNLSSGVGEMFKVKQKTAKDYVVNENHILRLIKSNNSVREGRYPQYGDFVNIGVKEFASKSKRFKDHFHGYKCGVLNFNKKDHKIPPYVLGAWLGDGTESGVVSITCMDDPVLDAFSDFGISIGCTVAKNSKKDQKGYTIILRDKNSQGSRRIEGISQHKGLKLFQEEGLLGNKHIPHKYIATSEADRLELLAGLLDTDGHYRLGYYVITQRRKELIGQIKFVADTLGFKTNLRSFKVKGYDHFYWKLSIGGDIDKIPCKVERKKAKNLSKNKDWRRNRIDIEPMGVGEYFGFELDKDHLFLLKDGTVTHNSHSFATALVLLGSMKPIRVLCCREIQKSIRDSVKRLIDDKIVDCGLNYFYNSTLSEINGKNGTLFLFAGLRSNPESIKSMEGIDICWVEEASTVSRRSLDFLIPTIRKEESEIWFSWNPDSEEDPVDKMFRGETNPPSSTIREVGFQDNPWFPNVLKLEMDYDKETDEGKWRHIWLGEYADVQDGKMFVEEFMGWQREFLKEGEKNGKWTIFKDFNLKHRYCIGADVAEGVGLDSSTAVVLDLTDGEVVAEYASNEIEPDVFALELHNYSKAYGHCLIGVERNNCGLTTVTKLRDLSANIYSEEEHESGHNKGTKNLGWRTTAKSKPLMLYDLKDVLVEKELKVVSKPLFKELKTYNPEDLRQTRFDPEQTRHFDRVMALCIAWQMRDKSKNPKDSTKEVLDASLEYLNSD